MTFLFDQKKHTVLETRKKLKSPVFRTEDGLADKRDFLEMPVGPLYHAYRKYRNVVVWVKRID